MNRSTTINSNIQRRSQNNLENNRATIYNSVMGSGMNKRVPHNVTSFTKIFLGTHCTFYVSVDHCGYTGGPLPSQTSTVLRQLLQSQAK